MGSEDQKRFTHQVASLSLPAKDLTNSASTENSLDFAFKKKIMMKRPGFLQEGKGNKKRFSLNSSLPFLPKSLF